MRRVMEYICAGIVFLGSFVLSGWLMYMDGFVGIALILGTLVGGLLMGLMLVAVIAFAFSKDEDIDVT